MIHTIFIYNILKNLPRKNSFTIICVFNFFFKYWVSKNTSELFRQKNNELNSFSLVANYAVKTKKLHC